MAGVFPAEVRMLERRKRLSYCRVRLSEDSLWGDAGAELRGHEFHYSEMIDPVSEATGWKRVYSVRGARGGPDRLEGYQNGNILVSYIHLHFASRPQLVRHFLQKCRETP